MSKGCPGLQTAPKPPWSQPRGSLLAPTVGSSRTRTPTAITPGSELCATPRAVSSLSQTGSPRRPRRKPPGIRIELHYRRKNDLILIHSFCTEGHNQGMALVFGMEVYAETILGERLAATATAR